MNSSIILIIILVILLILGISELRKSNSLKRNIKNSSLFNELQKKNFESVNPNNNKDCIWLTKKSYSEKLELHCVFETKNGKLKFELHIEFKKRVLNEKSGIINNLKISNKYKHKRLLLTDLSFIKNYGIKKYLNYQLQVK